jgi:hypothetical protein
VTKTKSKPAASPGGYENAMRSVSDLIPYAKNARTHDSSQIIRIASSIKEFGFTNPVLIDEANGIVAGHCRVLAARKLGITRVPCRILAGLSDSQRRAYVIADNKLQEAAGGWNDELLSLELTDLRDDGFDLDLIGFSTDELTALLDRTRRCAGCAGNAGERAGRYMALWPSSSGLWRLHGPGSGREVFEWG